MMKLKLSSRMEKDEKSREGPERPQVKEKAEKMPHSPVLRIIIIGYTVPCSADIHRVSALNH